MWLANIFSDLTTCLHALNMLSSKEKTKKNEHDLTQFSPEPVPSTRKLPQAFYPQPPEGRQDEPQSQKTKQVDHMDHSLL